MDEGVTFKIGGEDIFVPVLSWRKWRKIWPVLDELKRPDGDESRPLNADEWARDVDASVKILAIAVGNLRPDLTEEEIGDRLLLSETHELTPSLTKLFQISGSNPSGEAQAARSSTETSTASSPT